MSSITFGKEFRKTLSNDFQVYMGSSIGVLYSRGLVTYEPTANSMNEVREYLTNTIGVSFILPIGAHKWINNNFRIGIKLDPMYQYQYVERTSTFMYEYESIIEKYRGNEGVFDIDLQRVNLHLAYRF